MKRIFIVLAIAGVTLAWPWGTFAQAAGASCTGISETRDTCLIGKWVMTETSKKLVETRFAKFMFGQVRASGGKITSVYYTAPVAILTADGRWTVDHPMSIAGTASDDGVTFSMKLEMKVNRSTGQWASDGSKLVLCPQGGKQVGTMTVNIPGIGNQTIPMNNPGGNTESQPGRASYNCSGATLKLTTEPNEWIGSLNLTFKRIGR